MTSAPTRASPKAAELIRRRLIVQSSARTRAKRPWCAPPQSAKVLVSCWPFRCRELEVERHDAAGGDNAEPQDDGQGTGDTRAQRRDFRRLPLVADVIHSRV